MVKAFIRPLYLYIGGTVQVAVIPPQQQLLDAHVQHFTEQAGHSALQETPSSANGALNTTEQRSMVAEQYLQLPSPALVSIGEGLPALSQRLIEKIKAGEYVDFSDLPPTKGKSRSSANDWVLGSYSYRCSRPTTHAN